MPLPRPRAASCPTSFGGVHQRPRLGQHPNDRTLVAAIIAFGETLGKTLIVEGVQTRTRLDVITNLGAHLIQGNHYSPPLPAADVTTLLDLHHTPVGHPTS